MNKYRRFSRADVARVVKRNEKAVMDWLDDDLHRHKERLEHAGSGAKGVFRVAQQVYELLMTADISDDQRAAVVQIVQVLFNRLSR